MKSFLANGNQCFFFATAKPAREITAATVAITPKSKVFGASAFASSSSLTKEEAGASEAMNLISAASLVLFHRGGKPGRMFAPVHSCQNPGKNCKKLFFGFPVLCQNVPLGISSMRIRYTCRWPSCTESMEIMLPSPLQRGCRSQRISGYVSSEIGIAAISANSTVFAVAISYRYRLR